MARFRTEIYGNKFWNNIQLVYEHQFTILNITLCMFSKGFSLTFLTINYVIFMFQQRTLKFLRVKLTIFLYQQDVYHWKTVYCYVYLLGYLIWWSDCEIASTLFSTVRSTCENDIGVLKLPIWPDLQSIRAYRQAGKREKWTTFQWDHIFNYRINYRIL